MAFEIPGNLLESLSEKSVELCKRLVQIPSEDPPGDTRGVAGFIDDFFRSNGIPSTIVSPHPEKPSVVAHIEGGVPGKHVVFNGHIDTFPVGDVTQWSHDPFGGEIVDGRLYGRGAADMKGGVAASMAAALILNEMKESLPGKVSFTCVSDEEVDGPWGTHYLLEHDPELYGDALINGEPSSIEHVRVGEKGIFQIALTLRTQGGHGAYAGLKSNAILDMQDLLRDLLTFESDAPAMDRAVRDMMERARASYESILGPGAMDAALRPSLNVGVICGGIMVNMVPEKCEARLDFRLPPGVDCAFVKAWLARKLASRDGVEYAVIKERDTYLTDPEHELVKIATESAREVRGKAVYNNYSLGGTEACLWRAKGVPAVTYGPNHHNMGSPDEYIFVDELPIVAKVHALTAWRFLTESR